jgi:uncharacterized protein (DUF2235 family)
MNDATVRNRAVVLRRERTFIMKRLVICCDGTWNRDDAENPTNVVKLARSTSPSDRAGTRQLVHYARGVGAAEGGSWLERTVDRLGGGAFGWGLDANIVACYRWLAANYAPGDEIYIFGYSRGAYTARSLAGLIRTCSIPDTGSADRIGEAMSLYRERGAAEGPDTDRLLKFRAETAPGLHTTEKDLQWRRAHRPASRRKPLRLRVTYLGIWDTVGALGVPNRFAVAGFFNRKYTFHDTALSSSVKSARHAVAIDERRSAFEPTLWGNLADLNQDGDVSEKRYLQQWFPGDHGSVGGGGSNVTLSSNALLWIAEGAMAQGMAIDDDFLTGLAGLSSYRGHLASSPQKSVGLFARAISWAGMADREGPGEISDVSTFAQKRWRADASELPEERPYRPYALAKVADDLGWEGYFAGEESSGLKVSG